MQRAWLRLSQQFLLSPPLSLPPKLTFKFLLFNVSIKTTKEHTDTIITFSLLSHFLAVSFVSLRRIQKVTKNIWRSPLCGCYR